jgi:hypothetical protein
MTGATNGLYSFIAALNSTQIATYTVFKGAPSSPEAATGKTAGRFIFIRDSRGLMEVEGASDSHEKPEATIMVGVYQLVATATESADYDRPKQVLEEIWAALIAAGREYSSGGTTYHVLAEVPWTRARYRRARWLSDGEYEVVIAQFDVEVL